MFGMSVERGAMKRSPILVLALSVALLALCSCVVGQPNVAETPTPADTASRDYEALAHALEAAGATVEIKDALPAGRILFSVAGREFLVNHMNYLAVYAYPDVASAERDAVCIHGGDKRCPGGGGDMIVDYAAPPHFYKSGRILAEYVGMDAETLKLLTQTLGAPFTEQIWS